jgi:predicted DNA-binding transcriptional regulator YafY
MPRATDAERAQRLNRAFELLARGASLNEAAEALTDHFGLSRRQAYRYLQEAQRLEQPVAVGPPTVPITIKVPAQTIVELRAYAHASGLTMGEIVARAVSAFLARAREHG